MSRCSYDWTGIALRDACLATDVSQLNKRNSDMLRALLHDEFGFLISAELILIFTLMFCGVAVGAAVVRDALVQEFGDVGEAIGALNQRYQYNTVSAPATGGNVLFHATCFGSGFNDQQDDCDCEELTFEGINPKIDPQNSAGGNVDGQNN
jgi:hypothetical protein